MFKKLGRFNFVILAITLALAASSAMAQSVVYNAVPAVLNPAYPSQPFQAQQTNEFGDYVNLSGTNRVLNSVTMTMVTWAPQADLANVAYCASFPALCSPTTWDHNFTLNIYGTPTGAANVRDVPVGPPLATITQTKSVPWRPAEDPVNCPTKDQPGYAYKWQAVPGPVDTNCFNGFAYNVTFDMSSLNVILPNDVVVGIVYNTQTYGPAPMGVGGPFDSLNVGVPAGNVATVGTDDNTNNVFWNTETAFWYTDGGVSGIDEFREDSNWTPYGTVPIQITAGPVLNVAPAGAPTALDNDYTRINNAVQAAPSGTTISLSGTFNWTEANAAASWALGSDGISQGGAGDDYTILVPANRNGIMFTAPAPGAATIQGPGDLPLVNLEGVMIFDGGDNQNWILSNINYFDFDLAIGFFNGPGGTDAFNGTQILNNHIRIARDLNATVAPADVNQNIGIHYSFGANQLISGNTIDFSGDDVSNGVNFSSQIGMQSNTSGGAVYDGLQITNNILRVNFAQDAVNPQVILGIWENAHGHSSNVTVSGNSFSNLAVGNNPATNLQRGFRVTSHSSPTTTVTYANNSVSGANIGFQWIAGSNFTGNQPVRLTSNVIRNNAKGVFVQSNGLATLAFNRIVGNSVAGVENGAGSTTTANDNWWGCNYGPGAGGAGCVGTANGTTGTVTAATWLTLTTSATPGLVIIPTTSAVTSKLTINSASVDTSGSGNILNGTPATFAGTFGTVLPAAGTTTLGVTGTTFTPTSAGVGGVATTVDGQTVNAAITVFGPCSTVSTAAVSTLTGVGISIPVTTDNMTGSGAISADFVFKYNNAVLTPKVVAVLAGPVAGGGAVVTFRTPTSPIPSPAGTVIVSVVNPAGFTGAGALVTMEFDVIGVIGSTSILDIDPIAGFTDDQLFNGGYLQCNTINSTALLTVISGTVSGQVTYGNAPVGPPIPVRGVLLDAPGSPNVSDITDAGGLYSMSGFGPGSYIITASKTAYPVGTSIPAHGIFADDATAIVQHVVGLVPITNPSQLAAAKVSGIATPALSSFDAALISQWIVAISSPVNQTGQWKLTPPSQPSTVYTANATQNYTALLMGDVNQSWNNDPLSRPALTEATKNSVLPSITSMEAEKGREVIVPFRIDNLGGKSVGSYQFDIEFDPEVIEPVTVAADVMGTMSEGLTVISNSPEPGLLKVAAYGALPASGDGVYVNLKFRTIGAVGSTTRVTIREFIFNNGSDEVFAKGGRVSVTRESDDMGIKGRVISALGQPVSKARVTLTATDGTTRTTVASSLGSYEFSGLTAGETYTVTVSAKRFTFESRSVSMTGSTVDLDMIARQ